VRKSSATVVRVQERTGRANWVAVIAYRCCPSASCCRSSASPQLHVRMKSHPSRADTSSRLCFCGYCLRPQEGRPRSGLLTNDTAAAAAASSPRIACRPRQSVFLAESLKSQVINIRGVDCQLRKRQTAARAWQGIAVHAKQPRRFAHPRLPTEKYFVCSTGVIRCPFARGENSSMRSAACGETSTTRASFRRFTAT